MMYRARVWLSVAVGAVVFGLLGAASARRLASGTRNGTAVDRGAIRLVLLSAPRSGSTLLVEMLRTHEQILMHGEPFHRSDLRGSAKDGFAGNVSVGDGAFARRRSAPLGLLEEIASKAAGRRVVGFKLFSKHLEWENLPVFLQWATHLVLLRRSNALEQYVSICLAQKSNVWATYADTAKPSVHELNVTISPDLFAHWRDHEAAFMSYAREAVAALDAGDRPGQETGDSTSLQRGCSGRTRSRRRIHLSRTPREVIARPKMSHIERKTTEIRGFF